MIKSVPIVRESFFKEKKEPIELGILVANRTILFRHGYNKESRQAMNWSTLEEEVPHNRNIGTIHELDVMIGNLKRAIRNSKSSL
jgi:hypothetical protein